MTGDRSGTGIPLFRCRAMDPCAGIASRLLGPAGISACRSRPFGAWECRCLDKAWQEPGEGGPARVTRSPEEGWVALLRLGRFLTGYIPES